MSPDRGETLDFTVMHIKSNETKIVENLPLYECSTLFMSVNMIRLEWPGRL